MVYIYTTKKALGHGSLLRTYTSVPNPCNRGLFSHCSLSYVSQEVLLNIVLITDPKSLIAALWAKTVFISHCSVEHRPVL